MANIEDYLKWRGDLSFSQVPFNEIDSLILTQLCYLDFERMIPAWNEKKSISMAKLIEKYWMKNIPAEIEKKAIIIKNPSRLLGALKKSRRFSELYFANYINRVDKEKLEQFSAMTVWIPDGSIFVSYMKGPSPKVTAGAFFDLSLSGKDPVRRGGDCSFVS